MIDRALAESLAGDIMSVIGEETLDPGVPVARAKARPATTRSPAGQPLERVSDQDLLALVAREDRQAFGELYDRYGAAAYRLAHRVTRDSQHAETVVQETFLTVWRQIGSFDACRAKPATWLLSIAHHKAVDTVRHEQLRRTESSEHVDELVDESVDLHREAWLEAQRLRVEAALGALSAAHREVIELAYFTGQSQNQLARLLEQPLGTIKSRSHGALARLRELLEADGFTAETAFALD